MSERHQLGELLQELKERSGRSYTALASRTGLSRSSVHRYCQGLTVPASFGTVERIARVCGAGQEELDSLYEAWARADAAAGVGERDEREESVEGEQGEVAAPQKPLHARKLSRFGLPGRLPRPRLRTILIAALVIVTALVSTLTLTLTLDPFSGPDPDPDPGGSGKGSGGPRGGGTSGQRVEGPYWALAPKPLDREFFGVTMNTNTGLMPDFDVSSVRLWESETRWAQVEPEKGEFDWGILERSVRGAERKRLPVLFVFGGTPGWAAPGGPKTPYSDDSRAAPPDDLADWDRFVEKVATRYRSRIGAYELWDHVGATSHYDGNMATLAKMVRRAAAIIKRADPEAKVACPSFGNLWEPAGRELLEEFVRTGAYEFCDVAALKLHPRRADGPPEEIIELAAKAEGIFRKYSEGWRMWNTGPGAEIDDGAKLSDRRANDYAVRFYLVGLYSRKSFVDRMYFYAWGGRNIPLVVQPVGGSPTEAGRRIGRLHGWLAGRRITSCGQGRGVGLPDGVYECVFRRDTDRDPGTAGPWFAVRWTQHGRASGELGEEARLLRRMDGSSKRVRPGERVAYGETPVLVEYRA
ncbi:helix-turn-helix domain-containing protein [Streptomyces aureoverticillatus]|uniref:helix-turn-helix domain-containing protein n=1 Tax=Streptomyces aureoverticillatus TaxID=66871 RepID=UPI0013DAA8FC|nr:helix-turn-helix domain-containing protein [Streptomyces aureoverticillatus]QIB43478.1 helix-turn-helix domain-containing protein [Streptomyces aureoverticillatus]